MKRITRLEERNRDLTVKVKCLENAIIDEINTFCSCDNCNKIINKLDAIKGEPIIKRKPWSLIDILPNTDRHYIKNVYYCEKCAPKKKEKNEKILPTL